MAEAWERIYAKFFYVLFGIVIAVVLVYILITDFRFGIALVAVWGVSLAVPRLVPARILSAVSGWAFSNRLNTFLYFAATGSLVCLTVFLVRRHIDWLYMVTFVVVIPALNAVFFKILSEESAPNDTPTER